MLFQAGGISQIDTVDMKPEADSTIRGEFSPISSRVAGMPVSEHLPHLSQHMDKFCVLRSVHHRMLCHNPAIYAALAGREVGESLAISSRTFANPEDFPHFGSVVSKFIKPPEGMPPFVSFPFRLRNGPAPSPGQNAGFLGRSHDPFIMLQDPNSDEFRVEELELSHDMTLNRLDRRNQLLTQFEEQIAVVEQTKIVDSYTDYYKTAFSLISGQRVRLAFDMSKEPQDQRDKYGRNTVGQSFVLGRRLIEAGIPFVSVYTPCENIDGPSWDTHLNNFPRLKDELLPPFDLALSALIDDMHQSGLLEETLVIVATEFGRTPQVGARRSNNGNNTTGRDHWPGCYSVLLAGPGVTPGSYFGESDKVGWHPKTDPVHVGDLAATIYDAFGIDPKQFVLDTVNRPHLLAEGNPVAGLF
ncbi:MAG: DUF1501 domain-containing protein [Planctomycetota bacterium]|nr:DUF1501 domain-containing protein [Planctomycetota bacterium]